MVKIKFRGENTKSLQDKINVIEKNCQSYIQIKLKGPKSGHE